MEELLGVDAMRRGTNRERKEMMGGTLKKDALRRLKTRIKRRKKERLGLMMQKNAKAKLTKSTGRE
jgi:hypothetical protein